MSTAGNSGLEYCAEQWSIFGCAFDGKFSEGRFWKYFDKCCGRYFSPLLEKTLSRGKMPRLALEEAPARLRRCHSSDVADADDTSPEIL